MRTKSPDFKKKNKSDDFYDIEYDAVLIEQSIAKQYHILPSEQGELSYNDWAKLVSGLMNDTPLGKMVEIRCESDADIIKSMTSEQHAIRAEWDDFINRNKPKPTKEEMIKQSKMLENMMFNLFGREEK